MAANPDPKCEDSAHLRISDADREGLIGEIGNALAEGRLTPAEHQTRLEDAFAAKTYDDLAQVSSDLPVTPEWEATVTAIFGSARRAGAWRVPRLARLRAVCGRVLLDLREAVFSSGEAVVKVAVTVGAVEIILPDDVRVVGSDLTILPRMSSRAPSSASSGRPGAPATVRLAGFAFLGGVTVRHASEMTGSLPFRTDDRPGQQVFWDRLEHARGMREQRRLLPGERIRRGRRPFTR